MTESSVTSRSDVPYSRTAPHALQPQRLLWSLDNDLPGPTTVFIACMHGNEPAALCALESTRDQLTTLQIPIRGRIFAMVGNVAARAQARRFIDDDLNRLFRFTPGPAPQLELAADEHSTEYREAVELIAALQQLIDTRTPAADFNVIDLHTFSAAGTPFIVLSDTLRNRRFARCWPLPMILGLAEQLEGTLIDYLTACGCTCAVVETGQHNDPRSIQLHEAAIRRAICHARHIDHLSLPISANSDERMLRAAARDAPRVLDVQERYGIKPGELFTMRPGFANFDHVERGDHLADSAGRPIYAARDGRILLPLYQQQGDDGYFIARPIGRIWLQLSGLLRRVGISHFVALLPGVKRHPENRWSLLVDRHIARWLAIDVFHLLGYRLVRQSDDQLIVSRHQWDHAPPTQLNIAPPDVIAAASIPPAS